MCSRWWGDDWDDQLCIDLDIKAYRSRVRQKKTDGGPRKQVRPTDPVDILVENRGIREIRTMRWGLIPPWITALPKTPVFNARTESITVKPYFRNAIRHQRGVLNMSSYLEWCDGIPHEFRRPRGERMLAAAIWEQWKDEEGVIGQPGEIIESCCTVTCGPSPEIERIHDRMPVLLELEDVKTWFSAPLEEALALLVPSESELEITPDMTDKTPTLF